VLSIPVEVSARTVTRFRPLTRAFAGRADALGPRLWDPAAGAEQATLTGHTGPVYAVGVFTILGFGDVELAGELDWEPGTGPVYLRRLDDGQVWRADITVTVRPAAPGDAGAR
jgi:hypothetical protein